MKAKTGKKMSSTASEAAFRSLLRTFGLVRQVMEPYFARFGISTSQWAILRVLQRAQAEGARGLRLTDIGERLLIQPPSVTGVVDRLERQGLARRSNSKEDLRVRQVSLTPAGQELVERILLVHTQKIESLFTAHDPRELHTFTALLQKLEGHLRTLAEKNGEAAGAVKRGALEREPLAREQWNSKR